MGKVVNINNAKNNERITNKQMARYIVITMLEIMKQEQNIIDTMQAIVNCYDWENTELINWSEEDIKEYFKYMSDNSPDTKAIEDAMTILNDLVTVMSEHNLLTPNGTYSNKDIKQKYEGRD